MTLRISAIALLAGIFVLSCNNKRDQQRVTGNTTKSDTSASARPDTLVYQSPTLEIRKLSDHVFEHVSFLSTKTFGLVPCNGMIVVDRQEAIVFDTPATGESSEELIRFLEKEMSCTIKGIVATHFHADCVAGLREFHQHKVPSYAHDITISLLQQQAEVPMSGFADSMELTVGSKKVHAAFYGEGHTKDNIIGYFPDEKIMFGGCLVKEEGAGKGHLDDANVNAWPATVSKLKQKYPDVAIIIPGHGKRGGLPLLDYTVKLFQQ